MNNVVLVESVLEDAIPAAFNVQIPIVPANVLAEGVHVVLATATFDVEISNQSAIEIAILVQLCFVRRVLA